MGWFKDYAPIAISIIALGCSMSSAYFSYRSTSIAEASKRNADEANRRAKDALIPAVTWSIERTALRFFRVAVEVNNNTSKTIHISDLSIDAAAARDAANAGYGFYEFGKGPNFRDDDQENASEHHRGVLSKRRIIDVDVKPGATQEVFAAIHILDTAAAPRPFEFKITLNLEIGNDLKERAPITYTVSR